MNTFLRYIEFLSLGVWIGAIVYLSFVVAPGVFRTLPSQDRAGAVIGLVLGQLHGLGVIAGFFYLLAAVARARSFGGLARPGALAVILMVAITVVSQQGVLRRMSVLGAEMGSIERTPPANPLREQFDRLHRVSVGLESAVLLLGLVALLLTVREPPR